VKLNPVLDTRSLDPGQSVLSHVQVVSRREQESVGMVLSIGLVLSIAHISEPLTKLANVKLSHARSMEIGDHGHHGLLVPSHVGGDPRPSQECAILLHLNMEETNVQDITRSKLYVK